MATERKDADGSVQQYKDYLAIIDQMLPLAAQLNLAQFDFCGHVFNSLESCKEEIEKRIAALEKGEDVVTKAAPGAHNAYR